MLPFPPSFHFLLLRRLPLLFLYHPLTFAAICIFIETQSSWIFALFSVEHPKNKMAPMVCRGEYSCFYPHPHPPCTSLPMLCGLCPKGLVHMSIPKRRRGAVLDLKNIPVRCHFKVFTEACFFPSST